MIHPMKIVLILAVLFAVGVGIRRCSDAAYQRYLLGNAMCENHNCNAW